jgi:hypothetical protein
MSACAQWRSPSHSARVVGRCLLTRPVSQRVADSTRPPQPFHMVLPKWKEHSHGLKSSRHHRRRWFTARHIERLFHPAPFGAISFLGGGRCFRCCPKLELADGRRVASHCGSATVRVDDVQVHQTRDSQVRRRNCVTGQDVGVLIAAPRFDLAFRTIKENETYPEASQVR